MKVNSTRHRDWLEADISRPDWLPDMPVVSIITPNYNYGHFLENCIRSVLLQTYANIEYIIIDGGSSDDSIDIIRRYESFGITRWISESDDGQTDAINKGFAMTTGHLFVWLNSDDSYHHNRVIEQVVEHYKKGARFISAEWNAIDEHGNPHERGQHYGNLDPVDFAQCLRFWEHICPTQPATFVDRELASKVFPLGVSIECYMDYQLFLGVLAQSPSTAWIPEKWVDFVFHGRNKSLGNYTEAYDLDKESRAVFLNAACKSLSEKEFRAYKHDFERALIVRSAPGIPLYKVVFRALRNCPIFYLELPFWKAVVRKIINGFCPPPPRN